MRGKVRDKRGLAFYNVQKSKEHRRRDRCLTDTAVTRQSRADKQSHGLMTKSDPYIRLQILNKNGLLMAQLSRYQFIPSATARFTVKSTDVI